MNKIYSHEELQCEDGVYKYKVTIESSTINDAVNKELAKIAAEIRVPGFRKGKVPISMIQSHHSSTISSAINRVAQSMIEKVSGDIFNNIPDKERVVSPKTKVLSFTPSDSGYGDLVYEISFEMMGQVPDIECEAITLVRKEAIINTEDVQKELEKEISEASYFAENSEKKIEKGDKIAIEYSGKIMNKPFKGSTGKVEFIIGEGSVPELLENALLGMKVLDKKDAVTVSFPTNYQNPVLAGRSIGMDITVLGVKEPKKFDSNDEFAKHLGFESYEKLVENTSNLLQNQSNQITDLLLRKDLLDVLDQRYTFDIPKSMVDEEEKAISHAMTNGEHDTEDKDKLHTNALRRVKLGMLLVKFSEDNSIKIDNADLLNQLQLEFGHDRRLFTESIGAVRKNPDFARAIQGRALENKVIKHIVDKITIDKQSLTFEDLKKGFENA